MAEPRETHYQALGVANDASPAEIRRAYERYVESLPKLETPPDARKERRLREAHDLLCDPAQREAYDAALDADAKARAKGKLGVAFAVGSAVAALGAGIFGWQSLKSSVQPPAVAARPVAEIAVEAGRALGRVEAYDPSGQVKPLGLGVAVTAGSMVVACPSVAGGEQVRVVNGPRSVSARVAMRSESLGLCRLAFEGSGAASPLAMAGAVPAAGARVLAATLDDAGEARLSESKVTRVRAEGERTLVETEAPVPGAVLLDAGGRVVGVALGSAYAFLPRSLETGPGTKAP